MEFAEGNFRNREALRLSIMNAVMENEKRLGVCAESLEPALRFAQMIREAAGKYNTRVIILIDEYDKSILDNMDQPDMEAPAREELKAFVHTLFATIPYHNYTNNDIGCYEGFYASVIFSCLSSSFLGLIVEDCTNKGRIDMSVETEDTIYLIEFKVDMPRKTTLAQIKAKGYPEKYQTRDKKIVLIGIGFSSKEKNVSEFVIDDFR